MDTIIVNKQHFICLTTLLLDVLSVVKDLDESLHEKSQDNLLNIIAFADAYGITENDILNAHGECIQIDLNDVPEQIGSVNESTILN